MLWTLAAIGVLLVLSAFFSGSETALTAASRPLMHQKAQDGETRALLVNRLRERQERLIGAILLGNNLVNILASALATSLMISLFGETGVVYATGVMTLLVLVFSEILPKTYALNNADRMALGVARPMRVIVFLLAPITETLHLVVGLTLRLLGSDRSAATDSDAELRGAIDLHAQRHRIGASEGERDMLHGILDLDEVEVWEIMVHRKNVTMLDVTRPSRDLVADVLASPYTRIPLYRSDPDNIVGVLHAKEVLRAVVGRRESLDELDILKLAAPPWFIPETTTAAAQLQAFKQRHEHFALVVDEYGTFEGVLSLEDILEEIVGDIRDEHDVPVIGVQPQEDGAWVVKGDVTIRDLNRRFGWQLPDEHAATIAGLLLHESRRIPDTGQKFLFHGLEFEVLRRVRNQITRLRIVDRREDGDEL